VPEHSGFPWANPGAQNDRKDARLRCPTQASAYPFARRRDSGFLRTIALERDPEARKAKLGGISSTTRTGLRWGRNREAGERDGAAPEILKASQPDFAGQQKDAHREVASLVYRVGSVHGWLNVADAKVGPGSRLRARNRDGGWPPRMPARNPMLQATSGWRFPIRRISVF